MGKKGGLSLQAIALGVLAGIGGFTDTGGVVTATTAGAKFGYSLAWVIPLGVIGFAVYAEMSGRIAISSSRATWDLIRLRLGPHLALLPLVSTLVVHLLTLVVDLFGIALALQLATGVGHLWFIPPAAIGLGAAMWLLGFSKVDTIAAIIGSVMLVTIATALKLCPDFSGLAHDVLHPSVPSDSVPQYLLGVSAMLGAFMTPYQFDFYSSGALEEGWRGRDLATNRVISLIGPGIGGCVALGQLVSGALIFHESRATVDQLPATAQPATQAFGEIGLAIFVVGVFGVSLAAAVELCLSAGYSVCQYLGWDWGQSGKRAAAPVYHLTYLAMLAVGMVIALFEPDPIRYTTITMAFGAAALPFSFLPLLLVANDRQFMGMQKNGVMTNAVAILILAVLTLVAIGVIPLLVLTGGRF